MADFSRGDVYCPLLVESHPASVCEGSLLSSVDTNKKNLKLKGKSHPNLSDIQLEAVCAICDRHDKILPSGIRAGFLLGDGTGMGKTRTICGTIIENVAHGRKLHLILTTSSTLEIDFRRELFQELEFNELEIFNLKSFCAQNIKDGIIFCTYSMLNQNDLSNKLVNHLSKDFDGLIVFDECHMAKNYIPNQNNKASKTGRNVVYLQEELPNARVLYVSATGMGDCRHFAYLPRLGLWGPGCSSSSVNDFLSKVDNSGLSIMEYVAYNLKKEGALLSRHISMKGVQFQVVNVDLDDEFACLYDDSTVLWRLIFEYASEFVEEVAVMSALSGSQLRYFASLIVSGKIETCVNVANSGLKTGKQIVIGLQTTGEALYISKYSKTRYSLLRSMLENVLKHHLNIDPRVNNVTHDDDEVDVEQPNTKERLSEIIKAKFIEIRDRLPKNPLDALIDEFGGFEKVAEITGRASREGPIIENGVITGFREELRRNSDNQNVLERDLFQKGKKKVAIISDAASVGISLHSLPCPVTSPRLHITLEFPWSADRLTQQLGRTHRSNQKYPPEYVILLSSVPGEIRFTHVISDRLSTLGALTQGDSRCGLKILKEMKVADHLVKQMFKDLIEYFSETDCPDEVALIDECIEVNMFILKDDKLQMETSCRSLSSFFNKMLALGLKSQQRLSTILKFLISNMDNDDNSDGIWVLGKEYSLKSLSQTVVPATGEAPLILTKAIFSLGKKLRDSDDFQIYCCHFDTKVIHAGNKTGDFYTLVTALDSSPIRVPEVIFRNEFYLVEAKFARENWLFQYSSDKCVNFFSGRCHGEKCPHKRRLKPFYILSGDILRHLKKIKAEFHILKFVRTVHHNTNITGVLVPNHLIKDDKLIINFLS